MRNRIRSLSDYASADGLGPFLIRAVAGSGMIHLAGMLVTFVVGVLLARTLGVEGYGYYGIAIAVVMLAGVPGEFGLPQLVTREVAAASGLADQGRLRGVLHWANRMSLLFALVAAVIVAVIALLLPAQASTELAPAILLGALIVPLAAQTKIRGAALQGLHFITLGQLPAALLQPAIYALLLMTLFVVSREGTPGQAMALNAASAAAALAVAHVMLRRRVKKSGDARAASTNREWLASAVPMAMTEGMRVLQGQLGILLVGIMASPEETGLFRLAVSVMVMIAVPISLINTVSAPVLARLHAEQDIDRLRHLCRRAAQAMTAGVALLIVPFLLIGPPLLAFVFGSDFGPAYPALMIMAFGQLISAVFGPNATLLNMTGHEKRVTLAMLVAMIINAVSIWLLVPIMGHAGAAWATMAGLLAWNLFTWIDARRLLAVDTTIFAASVRRFRRKEVE